MIDRRTFATLLAGTVAAPGLTSGVSWGQAAKGKTVYYASVGGELTLYSMDVENAALAKQAHAAARKRTATERSAAARKAARTRRRRAQA